MRVLMEEIRKGLRDGLKKQKDEMGYNLAAVRFVKGQMESMDVSKEFVDEEGWEEEEKGRREGKGVRKRGFANLV